MTWTVDGGHLFQAGASRNEDRSMHCPQVIFSLATSSREVTVDFFFNLLICLSARLEGREKIEAGRFLRGREGQEALWR